MILNSADQSSTYVHQHFEFIKTTTILLDNKTHSLIAKTDLAAIASNDANFD